MLAIPRMISTRNVPHHPKKRTGYRGQAMGMSPIFSVGRVRLCQEVWCHEPLKETRHRKPLRPNPIAPWELRVGQLRVFYEVAGAESGVVRILAVGRKRRNVLVVGDKEI